MPRRTIATLATVSTSITVLSVLALAPSASADLVTHCVGTGGAVTVPTDLYVPPSQSCALTGTIVLGNVIVAPGANLVVVRGQFRGQLRVANDGYLDATDTTVDGPVDLAAGGYGLYLRNTRSGSVTVQPKGSATIDSFLFAERTTIAGNVAASAGEVRLDRTTQVRGDVSSTGTYYTDVHDSFVDGTLTVRGSTTGSVVCGSAVRGLATFAGNLGGVQLGPNGHLDGCASGGYWGRDVSVANTTGGVIVDDNIIDGQLIVSANDPAAQIAANNRIRGGVVGQQTAAAGAEAKGRSGVKRAEVRRSVALRQAAGAGLARLAR